MPKTIAYNQTGPSVEPAFVEVIVFCRFRDAFAYPEITLYRSVEEMVKGERLEEAYMREDVVRELVAEDLGIHPSEVEDLDMQDDGWTLEYWLKHAINDPSFDERRHYYRTKLPVLDGKLVKPVNLLR